MSCSVTVSICQATRCMSRRRRASAACPRACGARGGCRARCPSAAPARRGRCGTTDRCPTIGSRVPGARPGRRAAGARRRARPRGATRSARSRPSDSSVRRNTAEPGRAGWPRRRSIGDQLLRRDLLLVQQLVDDREVVELTEVGGEVERQARPRRDDDAVVAPPPVDWRSGRSSGGTGRRARSARWTPWRTEKWSGGRARHPAQPASAPAVGPVTKPAGWAAHSTRAPLLEGVGAGGDDEDALRGAAEHACGDESTRRGRPTSVFAERRLW